MPLPNEKEASELKTSLNCIFKAMDVNRSELEKLIEFRDTLFSKLISGEIDISRVHFD